jgi:signal transduction histidine kinase
MQTSLLTTIIQSEGDVVVARQRAKQIAALLGFDGQNQTQIATAVSEIARNAFNYAGGGAVRYFVNSQDGMFMIQVTDQGPGIADLDAVLAGLYTSKTGMGVGILGARRLMDGFAIESTRGQGTVVTLSKQLPAGRSFSRHSLAQVADELIRQTPDGLPHELHSQNRELMQTLTELQRRQEELEQLNRELEDTNRGVLALYTELDERAERLRRADEVKSRFLSNMSHEFRTPLNSIIALTRLLLSRADGELEGEQERQVTYIRKAAENLSEMVNDLLDLAKVEAGKISVHVEPFDIANLFSALRGMMRPLLTNPAVILHFNEAEGLPDLSTDEGKVSQILRNLIANALKFTEDGSVTVSAELSDDSKAIVFKVADTGIGIEPENQERIFQEFGQLDSPIQRRVKGTGLGLPLSRRLAELLGGSLTVESTPGVGSTFCATIPIVYPGLPELVVRSVEEKPLILLIDDEEIARYIFRNWLSQVGYRLAEASGGREGLEKARQQLPAVILLDLMMPDINGFEVLDMLKADPLTAAIPVVVATSKSLAEDEVARLERQAAAILSKANTSPDAVLKQIEAVFVK